MNPLDKVVIGKHGVEVTQLGLGGAPLSGMTLGDGLYGGTASDEAGRIITRAHELGINYFDTAPLYGIGRSEVRYGAALARRRPRQLRHLYEGRAGARACTKAA